MSTVSPVKFCLLSLLRVMGTQCYDAESEWQALLQSECSVWVSLVKIIARQLLPLLPRSSEPQTNLGKKCKKDAIKTHFESTVFSTGCFVIDVICCLVVSCHCSLMSLVFHRSFSLSHISPVPCPSSAAIWHQGRQLLILSSLRWCLEG